MLNPKVCEKCCKKQVLKIAKILNVSSNEVEKVLDEAFIKNSFNTAPEYAELIFSSFEKITGIKDPYKAIKLSQNKEGKELLPTVYELLYETKDELEKMVNLAITGNILDYGVFDHVNVKEYVLDIINKPFYKNDIEILSSDLEAARSVLYISDNAGEIIFDLEFIKYLVAKGITVHLAVRGGPAINDICIDDVKDLEIPKNVVIIDTGSITPGVVLKKTSSEFRALFYSCDVVIAKGQGNFETLHELKEQPKKLYLLFLAKCFVVSDFLKAPQNSKFLVNIKNLNIN